MILTNTIKETRDRLGKVRDGGGVIGLVPTMGALHEGHLELVRRSRRECGFTGVSIFVNPIQFNNPDDLAKYPRTLDKDCRMLEDIGCDLVFAPSVQEMYPEPVTKVYDFGPLATVMEGAFRPGHFNGVGVVVKKLFDIFQPDKAFFGEKDFQQVAIIRALVRMEGLPVEIVPCPTVREPDGLAMSSRNRRLSADERRLAPEIYRTLSQARANFRDYSVEGLKQWASSRLEQHGFKVDYFEIADSETLQPVENWNGTASAVACVACFLGPVRLIDNIILFHNFARP